MFSGDPIFISRRPGAGFTLVEVLIVVVILGVLASIVIPQFADATAQSSRSVFATNLKEYVKAAQLYRFDTGEYLEDSSSGVMPTGFDSYVDAGKWQAGTPIGGVWDAEYQDAGGVTSALGVHFDGSGVSRDDMFMADIDSMLDDGDLTTGVFRKIDADRYYFILKE